MQERREFPRLPMRLKVLLRLSDGEVLALRSSDISKQGIQLLSDYDADVGSHFLIAFNLQRLSTQTFEKFQVRAEVLHVVYDGPDRAFRIGLRFETFHGDGRERLEACLDEQLDQHLRRGRNR